MSEPLKYIIIEQYGIPVPIIFPPTLSHSDFRDLKPVRAGFVSIIGAAEDWKTITVSKELQVQVWGESESLKLKSDPKDARAISNMLKAPLL